MALRLQNMYEARIPGGSIARLAIICLLLAGVHASGVRRASASGIDAGEAEADRLRLQEEISRLSSELETLSASERGVLGELNRLDALARLRVAERDTMDREITRLLLRIGEMKRRLGQLEARQERTSLQLRSRLRALYRQGPLRHYRIVLTASRPGAMLGAFRHASALATADAAMIGEFRENRRELIGAYSQLVAKRDQLEKTRAAAEQARVNLVRARREKRRLLSSIQEDRQIRSGALEELRRAADALSHLAEGVSRDANLPDGPTINFARFQGLLPWPCEGRVASRFGRIMHPRFQTVVPHDGIDIESEYGEDIRSVFDGIVAYASWFSGYGLTLMIDHGGGYVSVYAHASVLLVEKGEKVHRGQVVGKVGDTGSLKGPMLYFEIRKEGRPVNPALWLRRR
jgi:septal ring factor EnvC (AmiA/AmiB activator)